MPNISMPRIEFEPMLDIDMLGMSNMSNMSNIPA